MQRNPVNYAASTNLMDCSKEWASRPNDQRFTSLPEMAAMMQHVRDISRAVVVPSRKIKAQSVGDKGMVIEGPNGNGFAPSNWAFGQLAALAGAPAGYLRGLPAALAADNINWGFYSREVEDVGVLLQQNGERVLRAATGPRYGRVWNIDVVKALMERFGDGITGRFVIPGEFGRRVDITKANTTLYASDRDMFVFLADEQNRIEVPGRRNGQSGSLARGFFCGNSEVGSCTLFIKTFLFDYACCNRIVWGATEVQEVRIRHSSGAPDRFVDELVPALETYTNGSTSSITKAIEDARAARLTGDSLAGFLASRQFGRGMATQLQSIHQAEEGRPIESAWDVVTALTAKARGIPYQDERIALETEAGKILTLAAA